MRGSQPMAEGCSFAEGPQPSVSSPVDRHLGRFQLGAISNSPAENICVQACVHVGFVCWADTWQWNCWAPSDSPLGLSRTCQLLPTAAALCTFLAAERRTVSPRPGLLLFPLFLIAVLVGGLSLRRDLHFPNECAERLCTSLLVIGVSSSVKCLFESFAHF